MEGAIDAQCPEMVPSDLNYDVMIEQCLDRVISKTASTWDA